MVGDSNILIALVIGASSKNGVGYACAERLHKCGFKVLLAGRNLSALTQFASELEGDVFHCDISLEASVAQLSSKIAEKYGLIHVAVNAAGQAVVGSIKHTSEEQLDTAIAIHLKGPFYFFKHLSSIMDNPGSMITLSTVTATSPIEGHGAYAASKAGADQLVQTAALELAHKGIKVNAISPGFMITDMTKVFVNDNVINAFIEATPMGRLTTPNDIANSVVWLSGDAFITGQNLQVNGGITLRGMPNRQQLMQDS